MTDQVGDLDTRQEAFLAQECCGLSHVHSRLLVDRERRKAHLSAQPDLVAGVLPSGQAIEHLPARNRVTVVPGPEADDYEGVLR